MEKRVNQRRNSESFEINMYWSIYILGSLLICHFISTINKNYYLELFFLFLVIFITPAMIEVSNSDYGPSLFIFLFDLFLEQKFSIRPLRPLILTIPTCIAVIFIVRVFKKKFF